MYTVKQFSKNIKYIFLFSCLLFSFSLSAQEIKAEVKLDTNRIVIGDQVTINLSLRLPKSYPFRWTALPDTLAGKIEIVSKSAIDTIVSADSKNITLNQHLTITAFDSGYYAIPPFSFAYHKPGDTTTLFAETEALLLNVTTVAVDTTKAIKDIKPLMGVPITFGEILPWLGGALALAGIIAFIVYYFKRRRKALPLFNFPVKPPLPPHEKAFIALEELKNKKLWQTGFVKDYHTAVTDIIRQYIEERFFINAVEMTSDEILWAVKGNNFPMEIADKLREILVIADLVKFAKEMPLSLHNEQSMAYAFDFVRATLPATEPQETTKEKSLEIISQPPKLV
jgi:hypothetical protein